MRGLSQRLRCDETVVTGGRREALPRTPLIVSISSFTLSVLGPPEAQAFIDLHEMKSMDGYPDPPSSVTGDRMRGKRIEAVIHCALAAAAVSTASIRAGRPEAKAASHAASRSTHL